MLVMFVVPDMVMIALATSTDNDPALATVKGSIWQRVTLTPLLAPYVLPMKLPVKSTPLIRMFECPEENSMPYF